MGSNEHDLKVERKIEGILQKNRELMGFYLYIKNSAISTVYNYLLHIVAFYDYIGNKNVVDLDEEDFIKYMKKVEKNENGEQTSSSYRITVYSALKKYASFLVETNILKENPMSKVKRPKDEDSKKTIEKRENGFLSMDEIQLLIKSVKNGVGSEREKRRQYEWKDRDLSIITLLLTTGIKGSELEQINVQDVDLENKIIYVNNKVKEYEISDDVANLLTLWIKKREIFLKGQNEIALFISNRRTIIDYASIFRIPLSVNL